MFNRTDLLTTIMDLVREQATDLRGLADKQRELSLHLLRCRERHDKIAHRLARIRAGQGIGLRVVAEEEVALEVE